MHAKAVEAAREILLPPDVGIDRLHIWNASAEPQKGGLA
jgi:hypothetical protein